MVRAEGKKKSKFAVSKLTLLYLFFLLSAMKRIIISIALSLPACFAFSQNELSHFNKEQIRITRNGMMVLGAWGAANTVAGAIGLASANGEAKYFHQMNLIWGVTNFAIAGATYIGLKKKETKLSASQSAKQQSGIEKTFLINGGLDLVYITAGLYCLEKKKTASNPDRYKGYGNSLLLQGGGLLLFDAVMYFTHVTHGKALYQLLDKLQFSGNSAAVVWHF
jgi:uncharacterized protein DUF6992